MVVKACAKYSPDSIVDGVGKSHLVVSHPNCPLELNIKFKSRDAFNNQSIQVNGLYQYSELSNRYHVDSIIKKWVNITIIDSSYASLFEKESYHTIPVFAAYDTMELLVEQIVKFEDSIPTLKISRNINKTTIEYDFNGNIFYIDTQSLSSNTITINGLVFKAYIGKYWNTVGGILDKLFPVSVVRELKLKEFV
jgi:hypothetical protein